MEITADLVAKAVRVKLKIITIIFASYIKYLFKMQDGAKSSPKRVKPRNMNLSRPWPIRSWETNYLGSILFTYFMS